MNVDGTRGVFDRERLLERLGGDEDFVADVIGVFLEESPKMLASARAAVEGGNAVAIERAAHALKGALLNIAAENAAAAALALERIGRDGSLDGSADTLVDLEHELTRLQSALVAAGA